MRTPKVSDEKLAELLLKYNGIKEVTARAAGMSRQNLHKRIANSELLQESASEGKERTLDLAEAKLIQALNSGENWAIRFTLEKLGGERGYASTHNVNQNSKVINIIEVPELSAYEPSIDEIREH